MGLVSRTTLKGSSLVLAVLGCAANPSPGFSTNDAAMATPWLTLPAGSPYFERDGRRAPVLLRNVSAPGSQQIADLLAPAAAAGTTVLRIQLTQGPGYSGLGIDKNGGVLPDFASNWDFVFDQAAQNGLAVIPVFGLWGDWNNGDPPLDGSAAQPWQHFDGNPLNRANGGPAATPSELFVDGSATQQAWLAWMATLVRHWSGRSNIIAWEIFSELDLVAGATEAAATAFAERAADQIRANDPAARPILASTSDLPPTPWVDLWSSRANDLISIHPYLSNLDQVLPEHVLRCLALVSKPVFVGESGSNVSALSADGTTVTLASDAATPLRHAIWSELVSGAADARALWWEDGYAIDVDVAAGYQIVTSLNNLERTAADWLAGMDFTGLVPTQATSAAAALVRHDLALGWLRNPTSGLVVSALLGDGVSDGVWTVTITQPTDGSTTTVSGSVTSGILTFQSPVTADAIAFRARP